VNVSSRPDGRARPVSSVHRALSSSSSSASGDGTDQSASGGSTSARPAARCTRSMARNRDVAVMRSRSPGACGPSATRRSGSASTTRAAFQASGNRGFGASGARHPRGSPCSMQRSGSMSRPRGAGCPMWSPGARKSRFALQSLWSARGQGKRSARPKKTGFGQLDTQVWSCPRSPSRFVLSRLLTRSYALHGGHGPRASLRARACPAPPVVHCDSAVRRRPGYRVCLEAAVETEADRPSASVPWRSCVRSRPGRDLSGRRRWDTPRSGVASSRCRCARWPASSQSHERHTRV
jgi:hypothetical protein